MERSGRKSRRGHRGRSGVRRGAGGRQNLERSPTQHRVAAATRRGEARPWDVPPTDGEALWQWVAEHVGVQVPRRAMIRGHHSPFDYLCHAFFEGRGSLPGRDEPPARARNGTGPADDQRKGRAPGSPADVVVWANRGGGKTFTGALATALDLIFKPGIEVRIIAGSLEQAQRMHAHLRAILERPALAALVRGRITDKRVRLVNGSGAELLAQSQAAVRGTRVQKIRCDEVELFDPAVWEAAQLTTRSGRFGRFEVRGSVECLSTMHVPHGIMSRLVTQARAGGRTLFRWNVLDVLETCPPWRTCPTCGLLEVCGGRAKERGSEGGFLSIDDALVMQGRVAEATWSAEMLCLRPRRTDAVFPEFDPTVHVVDALPWDTPPAAPDTGHAEAPVGAVQWVAGMDFGFRAPTVVLWGAVDGRGCLWIVDERVVAGAVLDEHIEAIMTSPWPRPAWIGVDPAGRQTNEHTGTSSVAMLVRAGLAVRDRRAEQGEGLRLIRARLKPASGEGPRLFIHRRCARLIESLEKYHYDARRPEATTPVKDGHDHAVDALRYLVVGLDCETACRLGRYV